MITGNMWSYILISSCLVCSQAAMMRHPPDVPPKQHVNTTFSEDLCVTDPGQFVCKWVDQSGDIIDSPTRPGSDYLQVAGTTGLDPNYHQTGCYIIIGLIQNMPADVWGRLATNARVGLFTDEDETTIFPEYEYFRDRPECEGTCAGACSNTCTGDGRKYDDLAGVGGVRATCVDDNFMCLPSDPYGNIYSVLVHEFGHTVHQYAMSEAYQAQVTAAYNNAYTYQIWDIYSYAMSNDLEYFAEGTATYFYTHFQDSAGGMNNCGKGYGQYCDSEYDARTFLYNEDIDLYAVLVYVFTGNTAAEGGLSVCP